MAGIGFVLRKLLKRQDLSGGLQAYGHAVVATSGPWVMTVISLGLLYWLTKNLSSTQVIDNFRSVILYNFCFSLVFTAPLTTLATRFLSDCIYRRDLGPGLGLLFGALTVIFLILTPLSALFYFVYVHISTTMAWLAVVNFLLISAVWLINVFISALKYYKGITLSFFVGMGVAIYFSYRFSSAYGAEGMLFGFNIGLSMIVAIIVALIFLEYPTAYKKPFHFLSSAKNYWEIMLGGLFFSMAIWVDKWIMWFSPEATMLPNRIVLYPYYDSAMFVAYLTVIPAMAMFMLTQETAFFELYVNFYRDVVGHANYDKIKENKKEILRCIIHTGRNLVIMQIGICVATILFAPMIFELTGMNFIQIGIFRYGILGASFQVLSLFLLILLAYFENRRGALYVSLFFLLSNAFFTWMSLQLGFAYYGYGYFIAALLTFVLSAAVTERYLNKLLYHTFITANASVTSGQ